MNYNFEEIKAEYRKNGLNIFELSCGCSIKIDLNVVYSGLSSIKNELYKLGVLLNDRVDAYVFPNHEEININRRVYKLNNFNIDQTDIKNLNPSMAIILLSLCQKNTISELFAKKMLDSLTRISTDGVKFVLGKGHSIKGARSDDDEFMLLDFISVDDKDQNQIGYIAANNDTIQVIDPTRLPSDRIHVDVALSNALNDLMALGVTEDISFYPVYNAPNEELLNKIESNIYDYLSKYDFDFIHMKPVGNGNFLMGGTVIGRTYKEPPMFYDKLTDGDKILVHRPFGDLAPITGHLYECIEKGSFEEFNLKELKKANEDVLSLISKPNLKVGEIINKYCPEFGERFSRDEHIIATSDISGQGIYTFKELTKKIHRNINLKHIPLLYEELSATVVQMYLLNDGTAGTNGAIIMMASEHIIENIYHDLHKNGYDPRIIGEIGKRGEDVFIPKINESLISSPSLLKEFKLY
ncbi:MAG: SelD-related putative sulfur metabolism protein [Candidatus Methanoperedens sp.]|nr:SelD-related putative sulfur metabolism protein [Candidatus Methanoperedens sp.]MCZ7404184.1 SelD-related putative sulfur metabolism protein [Candidatus Methanoperedens sp.]